MVLAVGSGATLAGWLLGTRLLGAGWRVEGVTVSRPADEARERVRSLGNEAAALAGAGVVFRDEEIVVHGGFLGQGYGIPTAAGSAAIEHVARGAGIFLDPTYTGKAFACLSSLSRDGRFAGPVVFVHTGGEPALFAGVAA